MISMKLTFKNKSHKNIVDLSMSNLFFQNWLLEQLCSKIEELLSHTCQNSKEYWVYMYMILL